LQGVTGRPAVRGGNPALRKPPAATACTQSTRAVAWTQRKFATDARTTWERSDTRAALNVQDGGTVSGRKTMAANGMNRLRVVVVDADEPARERLRALLESIEPLDACEAAASVPQAARRIDALKPHLVLLRVDFPKTAKQTEKIAEQNRLLAEAHSVRGYPTVVFINPRGQKFGEAKYMKGGPTAFIEALDGLRKADYDRRTILSDQFKPDDVK
jgi:CheY-like chemotaxis protein